MDSHFFSRGKVELVSLLLVLAPLISPHPHQLVHAFELAIPLEFYRGDVTYMNNFAVAMWNFPQFAWASDVAPPCPTGNWIGVTCNSDNYVTDVDLSAGSVSGNFPRLKGPFSFDIAGVIFLKTLNLAGNNLQGPIPSELALSPSLSSLNVANNSLTGRLSEDLCNLNLTCVNVMGNPLRGPIPSCWRNFTCLDFANTSLIVIPNETCQDVPYHSCNPPLAIAEAPPSAAASSANIAAIIGGVVGGAAFIALLVAGGMVLVKHLERKRKEEEERRLEQDLETQISSRHFGTLRRYSAEELLKATNGFDEDYVLGEGGFSKVYKGKLEDGKFVAIKRIKDEKRAGGELQFLSEVEMISRAVHRNLIRAEGFCVELGECMLVLPFCSNGSVASRTQGKEGNPMDWPTRVKVARGAAEGVAYLHTDCKPKLVHRDIKAANVLLDENDEAVIADFGLAKEMGVHETHATTAVKGTIGHIAPEYFVSGQCSEKTDVYAFGVFLLELVSGKDVYGLTVVPEAEEILLRDWVSRLLVEGKADVLVDSEVKKGDGGLDMAQVEQVLHVALLCLKNDPAERPTMEDVAKMVSGSELTEKWQQWQAEAGAMRAEDLMAVVKNPSLWENTTTGISLDAFNVSGPR
ncbi:hypothetical protein CLOM_g15156 [Closterium sp. NIES-68]|nr:hypothetical protein CLOM_g15156 [Closterium sp. NIES-68]GJP59006.1 hypothetical protein CLOP_g6760 [Closterium sp. NIES-67]